MEYRDLIDLLSYKRYFVSNFSGWKGSNVSQDLAAVVTHSFQPTFPNFSLLVLHFDQNPEIFWNEAVTW